MGKHGAGLLIQRDDKILLVLRSGSVSHPGMWAIPGGRVEPGEDEMEAAVREGLEELGTLPPSVIVDFEPYWHAEGPFFAFATFLVRTKDFMWKPALNEENDKWGWFSPDKLPRPILAGTREALGALWALGPRS